MMHGKKGKVEYGINVEGSAFSCDPDDRLGTSKWNLKVVLLALCLLHFSFVISFNISILQQIFYCHTLLLKNQSLLIEVNILIVICSNIFHAVIYSFIIFCICFQNFSRLLQSPLRLVDMEIPVRQQCWKPNEFKSNNFFFLIPFLNFRE